MKHLSQTFCSVALLVALTGCAAVVPFVEPDAIGRGEIAVKRPIPDEVGTKVSQGVVQRRDKKTLRLARLTRTLGHENAATRTQAAYWLGEMQLEASSAVPVLGERLLKDDSRWVRRASAKALGKIGDPAGVQPLILALKDRDKWVAHSAANSLRKFRSRDAQRALANYRGI